MKILHYDHVNKSTSQILCRRYIIESTYNAAVPSYKLNKIKAHTRLLVFFIRNSSNIWL